MKKLIMTCMTLVAMTASAQTYPYQNPNLSFDERAHDLLDRLTLEEKALIMENGSPAIERLGLQSFDWWSEGLHGISKTQNATVFPVPIGMASSWDKALIGKVFEAVSYEARARFNHYRSLGHVKRHQATSIWTPNINIFRDPRWGRGQETWGEDPWYSGVMGVNIINALQGPKDSKYRRIYACAKHFAVHSGPEWSRHNMNIENLPSRDLWETYLPAFKDAVQKGDVREVMCAYQRFDGDPCCGSNRLLQQILRNDWRFKYMVVSDCGAIGDFWQKSKHHVVETIAEASAMGVGAGTDVECGGNYHLGLPEALKKGLISQEKIDTSVFRLLRGRFEMGEMDNDNEWSNIPYSIIGSKRHAEIADHMAHESMVLLKNDGTLPIAGAGSTLLGHQATIAILGPNANDSLMQWGDKNYAGNPSHTVTMLEGLTKVFPQANIIYDQVCDLVGDTVGTSIMDQCSADGELGFSATYWNNLNRQGSPAARDHVGRNFNLSASGGHPYADGVMMSGFSGSYTTAFKPQTNGKASIELLCTGEYAISINGKEVKKSPQQKDFASVYSFNYKIGENYNIEINFAQKKEGGSFRLDIANLEPVNIRKMLRKVKDADYVFFAGGLSPTLEGEAMSVTYPGFKSGDRLVIELPDVQRRVLKALHDAGKKVIYVNFSGSAIGFDGDEKYCDAILQAWYPGQAGGTAIADIVTGCYNPTAKLPVTFYKNTAQLPEYENYLMANRTYRFFKGEPTYAFGYGLSYTNFELGTPHMSTSTLSKDEKVTVYVPVKNIGKRDGTEIIQFYLRRPGDNDGPLKTLRGFCRIDVKAGQTATATIDVPYDDFQWWDDQTNTMHPLTGSYEVLVGSDSRDASLQKLNITLK